jgi:hypothetical protein
MGIKLPSRVDESLKGFALVKEINSQLKYAKLCRMHSDLDL